MMTRFATAALLMGMGFVVGGCAVETAPEASFNADQLEEGDSDLSATSRSYVTVRRDYRKCMAPMCGGYWVQDVNRLYPAEKYVSALDFKKAGMDETQVAKVLEAADGELVLHGKLGPVEKQHNTRTFLVSDAWRGMPGVKPLEGDKFYSAKDRDPQIQCFTAPCPNEMALELNSTKKFAFDGYSVKLAAKPHVNQDWLVDRVNNHNAIVAAWIIDGDKFPGGYAQILDASQVYLNIKDMTGPCPAFKLAQCPDGGIWTWERDVELCQIPTGCVQQGSCPSKAPPQCAEGYSVTAWNTAPDGCQTLVCDPTFVQY